MLRLNLSTPITASPNRLGVLAGDLQGWPNGRRLGDDVIDIAERAVGGALMGRPLPLGDGVDANDVQFMSTFPYAADPSSGFDNSKGSRSREAHGASQRRWRRLPPPPRCSGACCGRSRLRTPLRRTPVPLPCAATPHSTRGVSGSTPRSTPSRKELREALRLGGADALAYRGLAGLAAARHRFDESLGHAERAPPPEPHVGRRLRTDRRREPGARTLRRRVCGVRPHGLAEA